MPLGDSVPARGDPLEGTKPDKRWALRLVLVAGVLLTAAGVALGAYSLRPRALHDRLLRAVSPVTARQPGFLTVEWVERELRAGAVVIVFLGALLLAIRRPVAEFVGRALRNVARSAGFWRRQMPARIRAIPREASRLELATLAAIVVGGVALRLLFLNDPIRYDEAFSHRYFGSQPLKVGLSWYPNQNNHVLNSVLSHLSTDTFGDEPWAIRLPVFVAGCGVVVAAYLVGRSIFGRGAALVGTALVAVSSPLIEYSANARGYSFVVLAFLVLVALGRSLAQRSDPILWALFALAAALGMLAVPTMAYALGTVTLWLAAEAVLERRGAKVRALCRLAAGLLGAAALTVVLYAPVLAVGASGLFHEPDTSSDLLSVVRETWSQWTRDMPVPGLLIVGFLVALALHRRVSAARVPPIAAAVPVVALALAAERLVPYPRVWLFLLPLFLLTAGAGIAWAVDALAARLGSRGPLFPLAALTLGGALAVAVLTDPTIRGGNEGRDGPAITAWLKPRLAAHGGQVVSITPLNMVLAYYFPKQDLSADRIVSAVDPASRGPVFVVLPGGKSLQMLTGDAPYPPGEGDPFAPIPGLKEAMGGAAEPVKTFATASIYVSR